MANLIKVAHITDLSDGQMKQVTVYDDYNIVLARVDGEYFAIHGHCTHYGAPLAEGTLNGCRLVCPWHHACFDVRTGEHLEAPGIDSLPAFKVTVKNNDIYLEVPEEAGDRRRPELASKNPDNKTTYAIIGGGAAGAYAAEAMRQKGFDGKIVMITAEEEVPYDRPNCSKDYLQDEAPEEWMPLRSEQFYKKHGIELLKRHRVTEIDPIEKRIYFEKQDALPYDKLLICTGGTARQLSIPGARLDNVFTLRSMADSRRIRDLGKKVDQAVVIGASFIGMEGAMSLKHLGCELTVVAPEKTPFANIWGERVGQMIRKLHEEEGVKFMMERKVQKMEGKGKVEKVILDNGMELEAQLVLTGIGVQPATSMLHSINLHSDGGVRVDEYMKVQEDLYAAGDIVHYPGADGQLLRIEHWKVACQQGRIAGRNMAGAQQKYQMTPFFWSIQHGQGFAYIGHALDYNEIIYQGEVENRDFLAFYIKDGKVAAVLGMNRPEMPAIQEAIRDKRMPPLSEIKAGKVDWGKV